MARRVDLEGRVAPLVAGAALLAIAILVAAVAHETAVATVISIGGVGLIVYAFVFDRLESFGLGGLRLRKLKDRAARVFEVTASDSAVGIEESVVTHAEEGQAAAAIRAAESPEELIDTLVALIERPETGGEQRSRVQSDDKMRTRDQRYGPTSGSRG